MNLVKRRWTIFTLIIMFICSIIGAFGASYYPAYAADTWTSDSLTAATEDEKEVWTAAQNANLQRLTYGGAINAYNTFTFSFRPNDYQSDAAKANVTFHVRGTNNQKFSFQFSNYTNMCRFNYNDNLLVEADYFPNEADGWTNADQWVTVKCVFIVDNAQIYVNDTLILETNDTQEMLIDEGATAWFSMFGWAPSLKDMAFSVTEKPEDSGDSGETEEPEEEVVSDPNWTSDTYTVAKEEETIVWTGKQMLDLQRLTYAGGAYNTYNTFTFSFRPNDYRSDEALANITFHVRGTNNQKFSFRFVNYSNTYLFNYNDVTQKEGDYFPNEADGWTNADKWVTVKCVFIEDYAQIYINGTLIDTLTDTQEMLIDEGATAWFSSHGWAPSIKDMAFSVTEKPEDSGDSGETEEPEEEVVSDPNWTSDAYTLAKEDDKLVWTGAKNNNLQRLNYAGSAYNAYNTFTFAFRANEYYGNDVQANITFHVRGTNQNKVSFRFMPYSRTYYFNYNDATQQSGCYDAGLTEAGWTETDQWVTVKCIFIEDYAQIYINGTLIDTLTDTQEMLIDEGATAWFSSFACAPSLKDMAFSVTEKPEDSGDSGETEEPEEEPVSDPNWTSDTFTLAKEDDKLVWTAAQNAALQRLTYAGGAYNTYNTFTFSFRPNNYQSDAVKANITFHVRGTNNQKFSFQFSNYTNMCRFNYNDTTLIEADYFPDQADGWTNADQWVTVKCVFIEDYAQIYVNGNLILTLTDTKAMSIDEGATAWFSMFGWAPSLTDMAFSVTEKSDVDTGETVEPVWTSGAYTQETVDGKTVYTGAQNLELQRLTYSGSYSEYNTFTFAFRANEYFGDDVQANITFHVKGTNGNKLSFRFMPYSRTYYFNYNDATQQSGCYVADLAEEGWTNTDEWVTVKCVFIEHYAQIYINGTLIDTLYDTKNMVIDEDATCWFSSYACAPSLTDLAFSVTEKPVIEELWVGGNYTESEENGVTVYTATEETGASAQVLRYTGEDEGTYNTFSFSFRPNEYYGEFDTASVCFNLKVDNTTVAVTFMNYWKLMRVIKYVNGAETAWLAEKRYVDSDTYESGWNEFDVWYDVEVIYTNDAIVVSVNGVEIAVAVAHGLDVSKVSCTLSAWACAPSFADMAFSSSTVSTDEYTWVGSTFVTEDVDGETVYTSNGALDSIQRLTYALKTGTYNAITFEAKFNDGGSEPERNLTFNITSSDDTNVKAAFQLLPNWNAARLQLFTNGSGAVLATGNYEPTEWMTVTCVFEENHLIMYVNGELVAMAFNTRWNDFDNTNCNFSVWGDCASVKNMTFSTQAVDGVAVGWYGGSYTKTDDAGTTVYTAKHDGNVKTLAYSGTTGNSNTFTFEVNAGTVGGQNERNAGVIIYNYGSKENLFFEIMPARGEARIRLMNGMGGAKFTVRTTHEDINSTDWITVTCVFENEYVAMYINGELVLSYFGIEDCQFTDTLCHMSAWDTAASFKNMTFSMEEYSYADLGYADLDFLDEKGFDAVSAENAVVAYDRENQEVDVTVQATNPVVSFVVNQTVGGFYSAYLPIRNTILIRMANGTLAEQLKFYLLTSESDEWYVKTIEILPNSGYSTYYVNVSDLGVDGYLRGMKFEFVGVNSGTVSIDAISFEREEAIYEYAAETYSLLADKETGMVTFSGKLLSKYAGKEVKLIETDVSNFAELLTYHPQKVIATGTADNNGNFTITFPLKQEDSEMTHLSTIFLASVDGVKLAKSFQIENYRDFVTNPYAFELPELTVSVTDAQFGAKGDGFTNDNAAIQAAIDYVSAQGGGVVILPGETTNVYGRRYIATNLEMRNNVELRIEKGAVLWQSPRIADYDYDVLLGHDYETDVMWPHACKVNKPLILLRGVENVRVTGGGIIRMADWGGEEKDPTRLIDPNHGAACGSTIHIAPIYVNSSKNLEISDLTILRTNNWNLTTLFSENMFIANLHFAEANCKNGDGVGLCNAKNALLVRNRYFVSDDAITLNGNNNDPRWYVADWGLPVGDVKNGTYNIEIAHCNIRGGIGGIVFIPWGTGAEDLSTSEIKNIVAYDNVLSGFSQDIGAWVDDPFYGWSSNGDFQLQNGEFDDYAPIKDVYMYNNKYKFDRAVLTHLGNNVVADSANFITDSVLKCTSQFVNSSFERKLRYDGEETWVSGLSYWTSIVGENGEVGYEARGEKEATAKYSQVDYTVTDYAGFASNAKLYQGLYLERGEYTVTVTAKNVAGTAQLFFGKSLLKQHTWEEAAVEVLNTQAIPVSAEYAEYSITFVVETTGVYAIGIMHSGNVGEKAYIDDASIARSTDWVDEEALFEKAKADTQKYLSLAKSHDEALYTAESFAALKTAIANAEAALANANTDRATFEACADGLLEAMKSLVEIDFAAEAKATLESTVATAKTYTADKYTEESFAALQTAIANAEAAIANGATAEEYESLNTVLTAAIDGLTEKPATGCGAVAFSSSAMAVLALGAIFTVFARKRKN